MRRRTRILMVAGATVAVLLLGFVLLKPSIFDELLGRNKPAKTETRHASVSSPGVQPTPNSSPPMRLPEAAVWAESNLSLPNVFLIAFGKGLHLVDRLLAVEVDVAYDEGGAWWMWSYTVFHLSDEWVAVDRGAIGEDIDPRAFHSVTWNLRAQAFVIKDASGKTWKQIRCPGLMGSRLGRSLALPCGPRPAATNPS